MNLIKACDLNDLKTEEVISKVNEVLRSGWISASGPMCEQFEKAFAEYVGMKHCVTCSSGTTAIHLTLAAMGIGKNDEVIMPAFAPIFCSNPILWQNAVPVLVDVDKDTLCIDVSKIEEKITPKTKAIFVIDMYGHACDYDELERIAKKYNLLLIEDACESHGAEYKGRKCGTFGDVAIFSGYANKLVRMGEAGWIVTNNGKVAEEARRLRTHYSDKGEWKFRHEKCGFNYRLSDVLAAIGLVDLKYIDEHVQARRRNAKLYTKYLCDTDLQLPVERFGCFNTYWMFNILLPENIKRQEVMNKLEAKGIETRPSFFPVHWQPCYKDFFKGESYPNAEYAGLHGINLPSGNSLTESQIQCVCECLKMVI